MPDPFSNILISEGIVSAEQLAQQHVAAVEHAAIHAQDDALTQLVADER